MYMYLYTGSLSLYLIDWLILYIYVYKLSCILPVLVPVLQYTRRPVPDQYT